MKGEKNMLVRISHKCPYCPNMMGYVYEEPKDGMYSVHTINKYKFSKVVMIPVEYVRI